MNEFDTERGFKPVPPQTARTYIYTENSEVGEKVILITDPVAVRPCDKGQDVIHRESDGTLSIIRVPWGFLNLHIAEEREFSTDGLEKTFDWPSGDQTTVDSDNITDAAFDTCTCGDMYYCPKCSKARTGTSGQSLQDARDVMENGSDTEPAKYMPCMNDPEGTVSRGNECIYYPECGCQRPKDGGTYGNGAEGPPPNLDV